MPREIRKRGKRKSKKEEDGAGGPAPAVEQEDYIPLNPTTEDGSSGRAAAGSSGIHPARAAMLAGSRPPPSSYRAVRREEADDSAYPSAGTDGPVQPAVDPDHPFGLLHPDVKGYIHALSPQLIAWQTHAPSSSRHSAAAAVDAHNAGEEREDRQNFLSSVLAEIRGQELLVATDPDTAVVLERLMPSLSDWGRRVLGDALAGGWSELVRQRWGSHIVQTWLTLAAGTLDREARGVWPAQHVEQEQEQEQGVKVEGQETKGKLPTMAALVQGLVIAIQPELPSLLTHPQASPVLRTLLLLLSPGRDLPSLDALGGGDKDGLIRSKKSNKWRASHKVQGTSILGEGDGMQRGKGKGKEVDRRLPEQLSYLRRNLRRGITAAVEGIEWRLMGVNPVGSPTIQLLLEMEIEDQDHLQSGSLFQQLTENSLDEPKEYLASLLSSQLGSRLFETLLRVVPKDIFKRLWKTYFKGQIGRFAVHPFANFVVAKGVTRLEEKGMRKAIKECAGVSGGRGIIKTSRTSVLLAFVERSMEVSECQEAVLGLICSALDLKEDKEMLVPCMMVLKTLPTYRAAEQGQTPAEDKDDMPADAQDATAEEAAAAQARLDGWKNRRQARSDGDPLAPNMQGSLLLQALVRLGSDSVFDSLYAQPAETLAAYACSPIASHVYTTILTSPSVPIRQSKRLITALMGSYRTLAEDRYGSRIVDQVWDKADSFMRQKIAGSLVPHAMRLGENEFGKYVVRKMDLYLLERRPREWKERVGMVKSAPRLVDKNEVEVVEVKLENGEEGQKKRKAEARKQDAIDDLFETVKVKKQKA